MNFDNMGVASVCWAMRENMHGAGDMRVLWYRDTIHAAAEWLRKQQANQRLNEFEFGAIGSVLDEYKKWAVQHPMVSARCPNSTVGKAPPQQKPRTEVPVDGTYRTTDERRVQRSNMLQGLLLRHARRVAEMSVRELSDRLGVSVFVVGLLETGTAVEVNRWDRGWDDIWDTVGRFGIKRPVGPLKPVVSTHNVPEDTDAFATRRMHGADLRWARSRAGIMQEELGDLLGFGKAMVGTLEDGLDDPPFGWDALWSLMAHFEMPRPCCCPSWMGARSPDAMPRRSARGC